MLRRNRNMPRLPRILDGKRRLDTRSSTAALIQQQARLDRLLPRPVNLSVAATIASPPTWFDGDTIDLTWEAVTDPAGWVIRMTPDDWGQGDIQIIDGALRTAQWESLTHGLSSAQFTFQIWAVTVDPTAAAPATLSVSFGMYAITNVLRYGPQSTPVTLNV